MFKMRAVYYPNDVSDVHLKQLWIDAGQPADKHWRDMDIDCAWIEFEMPYCPAIDSIVWLPFFSDDDDGLAIFHVTRTEYDVKTGITIVEVRPDGFEPATWLLSASWIEGDGYYSGSTNPK